MKIHFLITLVLDLGFLALLVIVPAHAYDWMLDFESPPTSLPDDPLRFFRLSSTGIALGIVMLAHLVSVRKSRTRANILINSAIVVAITFLWLWKFDIL